MITAATPRTIRAGLQFSNYSCLEVSADELFATLQTIATTAEESGFDAILVVDHFYGLPPYGAQEGPMLEAYTLLGALAACTRTAAMGTLVSGVTFRNPAVLAKTVSTLDVISGGRGLLGIGAGWFEAEHRGLGAPFPTVSARFEMLEEALVICGAMFRDERLTFEGRHSRVEKIINRPAAIRGDIPILIGGQGERKTMPLMAKYADLANLTSDLCDVPEKLAALRRACEQVGRDPASLPTTWHGCIFSGSSAAEAEALRDRYLASRGVAPWYELAEDRRKRIGARWLCGDVEEVAERVAQLTDAGLAGVTCNVLAEGRALEAYASAGAALTMAQ